MSESVCDITIIGAGPVGLAAAYYAGHRDASVRIVESLGQLGGQVAAVYPEKHVYDVAGHPKIQGQALVDLCVEQGLQFGADVHLNEEVAGLERIPQNGEELLFHPWKTRFDVNAPTPVIADDRVFISSGLGRGGALVKLGGTKPEVVWETKGMSNKMSGCVLWARHLYGFDESYTSFEGLITARGGVEGGNGGFAEVSGKAVLSYKGLADLSAPKGTFGTLLLDPYNVIISDASSTSGFTASSNDSVINAGDLEQALGLANVTVTTGGAGSPGRQRPAVGALELRGLPAPPRCRAPRPPGAPGRRRADEHPLRGAGPGGRYPPGPCRRLRR